MKIVRRAHTSIFRRVSVLSVALLLLLCVALFAACGNDEEQKVYYASVSDDFKTEYYVGEALDPTGFLKTYFDNDNYDLIPITEDMVSGFDSSSAGSVVLKITYGEYNATIPIHVTALSVKTIVLDADTIPSVVYQGSPFPSGMTFTAHISDGSTREGIPVTSQMLGGFNSSILGSQTITIGYQGASASFSVLIKEDARSAISLLGAKQVYAVGEALSVNDARISVIYESGKSNLIALTAEMVDGFTTALGGPCVAKVAYAGLECDYAYTVRKEVTGFIPVLDILPLLYEKGDPFPNSGVGVLTYNDGTEEEISYSSDQVPDFDTSVAGNHTAHIIVAGFSGEYAYSVLPEIESALIYGYTPAVVQYSSFDGLGELILVYETGERESIALTSDRLSVTYATDRVGDVTQSVLFRRENVTFDVTVYAASDRYSVESIELLGSFSPIKIGAPIDAGGVQVRVVYRYLTPTVTSCDPSWVNVVMPESIEGDAETLPVTVSCFGAETTGSVRVLSEEYASRVTSLTPFGFKTVYVLGDELSLEGATLSATLGGGYGYLRDIEVQEGFISDFDTVTVGEKVMVVTYLGFSVNVLYRVISNEDATRVTDLMIYGFNPLLFEGDDVTNINVSRYAVKLTYGYGYSSGEVPLALEMISGGPFIAAGSHMLTVSYQGASRDFPVNVRLATDKSVVTSIRVSETIYGYVGTSPDFSTANLEVTYGYGYRTETIPLTAEGVTLGEYPTDTAGFVSLSVSYEGVTCGAIISFIAGSSENILQNIVISEDSKQSFLRGEPLTDVYLIVYYSGDRRPEKIAVNAAFATGFSTEQTGNFSITITYGGKALVYNYVVTEGEQ